MTFNRKKFPIGEYAESMHDVMLVSSFAAWAMLLGFAPVITWRLLFS
ncbi:MAG: hypothetical protein ABW175_02390 [Bradyrhizobium sp.]